MSGKRPKADFVPIGPVLKRLLREYEATGGGELLNIRRVWNHVVDPGVCENAQPVAINKDIVLVHVTSSPWLHQLQFLKQDILLRLNSELASVVLKDLMFKIGSI